MFLICLLSIWITWKWFTMFTIDSQTIPWFFPKIFLASLNLPQLSLKPGDTRRARHAKRDSEATGSSSFFHHVYQWAMASRYVESLNTELICQTKDTEYLDQNLNLNILGGHTNWGNQIPFVSYFDVP